MSYCIRLSSKKNLQTAFGMPLDGSDLQGVQAALTGTTATNADLQNISQDDFVRTAVIMLVGIIIVLIVITRFVSSSLFIIASLVLVYLLLLESVKS
ncbi:putative membrane protein YdgH [compost metagenome]